MTATDANAADPAAEKGGCCGSCSSTDTTETTTSEQSEESAAMITTTYTVTGMTCEHCVNAVSTEIGTLTGVSDVQVDLPTGAVTVTSGDPLSREQVAAAVEDAGYELTPTGSGVGTDGGRAG
ncbi:MAG: heavy-metal-associated domain-containing protein [Mycobacteriales bacterium]